MKTLVPLAVTAIVLSAHPARADAVYQFTDAGNPTIVAEIELSDANVALHGTPMVYGCSGKCTALDPPPGYLFVSVNIPDGFTGLRMGPTTAGASVYADYPRIINGRLYDDWLEWDVSNQAVGPIDTSAVLPDPVPEPATAFVLSLALPGIAAARLRHSSRNPLKLHNRSAAQKIV